MEVLVLGPVRVLQDGRELPLHGGRERAFLAALALARTSGIDTHRLVDVVWGEDAPRTAARTAASYLSRLRSTLGPDTIATTAGRHLLSGVEVDLWRFEALRERAMAAPADARACLTRALALWRDPTPASDALLDGAMVELSALARARLTTAEQLLTYLDDASAVDAAEALVAEDPFRERVWLSLARALDRLGRPAEALHALRRARRALVDELGLDPSEELRGLGADLLQRRASGATSPGTGRRAARTDVPLGGSVPAPLTALIGRGEMRDEVAARVRTHRLVTLTGTGGIGKTRLAVAVAQEVARHLDLPVHVAGLAGSTSARDVEDAVVRAVGADPLDEDPAGAIAEAIDRGPALLVVDSCEHVVTTAAPLIADVLTRCPRVNVLATSRVPLGVSGEVIVAVAPLELPHDGTPALSSPAVQLLAARAGEVCETGSWDEAQLDAAARICTVLDGIPLAIELAARQLRYAPPDVVVRDLENGGSDDGAPLQPFALAVRRSDDLLDPAARGALRRLALLAGPVPVDVAADIAGGRSTVQALVDASLLVPLGGPVRMYEPVRQYAAHLLGDDERRRARTLIAEAVTALAERAAPRLIGPDEVVWIAALDRVREDVRGVLRWADLAHEDGILTRLTASVGYLWTLGWGAREGRHWIGRALDRPAPDALRARLLLWSAMMGLRWGDLDAARADGDEAVTLARRVGDEAVLGAALSAAALGRMREPEVARARELLDEAVLVRRRCGDVAGAAMSLGSLADLETREGSFDRAAERYAIGLPLMRASRSERGLLAYLHSMAELEVLRGDPERAEALVEEARPLALRTGDLWHVGLLSIVAATAARDRGADALDLRELAAEALAACAAQTDPVVILDGVDVIGGILLDTGDAAGAARLLRASRRTREARRLPIATHRRRRRDADEASATEASGAVDVETPQDVDWVLALAAEALR